MLRLSEIVFQFCFGFNILEIFQECTGILIESKLTKISMEINKSSHVASL